MTTVYYACGIRDDKVARMAVTAHEHSRVLCPISIQIGETIVHLTIANTVHLREFIDNTLEYIAALKGNDTV